MYAIPSKDGMRNQASPPSSAASRMVGDGDPDVAREEALVAALRAILRSSPRFLEMLAAVRSCDPPDWMVGGGVLRDIVWDHLHCYPAPAQHKDVDVAFFDPADCSRERERDVQHALATALPGVAWDPKNQAGVHLWYDRHFGGCSVPPLTSTADGVATWPETVTCVAVRLGADGEIEVMAPYGLTDMFALTLRHNPRRVSRDLFRQRIVEKSILQRWPRVLVIDG